MILLLFALVSVTYVHRMSLAPKERRRTFEETSCEMFEEPKKFFDGLNQINVTELLACMDKRPVLHTMMIHELCHARHMNHSKRFWSLVGRFEPDYRQLDKGLNVSWKQIPTWVGIY